MYVAGRPRGSERDESRAAPRAWHARGVAVPLEIVVPGPVASGSRSLGRAGSVRPAGAAPHGARPSLLRRTALRWLPPSLSGARVDPGRPAAIVLVGVVLGGALLAGAGVWSNRPTAQPVAGLPEVTAAPVAAAGRAVVEVKAMGVCGSDVHAYAGKSPNV